LKGYWLFCSSGRFAANDVICDSSAGQSPPIPIRPGPQRRIDFEAAPIHFNLEEQPQFAAHTSMPASGVASPQPGQNESSDLGRRDGPNGARPENFVEEEESPAWQRSLKPQTAHSECAAYSERRPTRAFRPRVGRAAGSTA